MSRRQQEDLDGLNADAEAGGYTGPVRLRRETGKNGARHKGSRKSTIPRRKGTKAGGIHQRANKRMNW